MDTEDDFLKIQQDFQEWRVLLKGLDYLPLNDSLALFEKYKIQFPRIISSPIDYPLKCYRLRVISRDSKENISNPKTFSYPPDVKTYQRANVPEHPVFYGALDGKTAIEEYKSNSFEQIKEGDEIYLSEWRIKEGVKYTFVYLTLPHLVGDEYLYSPITQNVNSEIERIFKNESELFKQIQTYLFNQISELFLADNYLQSGIIAYQILYNTPSLNGIKIDGILYPSCSNNFRSVNCALLPDFVDKFMEIAIVRKLSFNAFVNGGANATGHFYGVMENNKVVWKTYVTKLLPEYKFEIDLTESWPDEQIINSKFFLENQELNFGDFCRQRIDEIDLKNHKIPQNNEEIYRANGNLIFNLTYIFKKGDCYFSSNNNKNFILKILLQVPVKALSKNVSAKRVLKY